MQDQTRSLVSGVSCRRASQSSRPASRRRSRRADRAAHCADSAHSSLQRHHGPEPAPVATGADQWSRQPRSQDRAAAPSLPEQAAPESSRRAPRHVPGVPGRRPRTASGRDCAETSPSPGASAGRAAHAVGCSHGAFPRASTRSESHIPGVRRPSATPGGPQPARPRQGMAATRFTLRHPRRTVAAERHRDAVAICRRTRASLASAPFTLQFDPSFFGSRRQAGPLLASGTTGGVHAE